MERCHVNPQAELEVECLRLLEMDPHSCACARKTPLPNWCKRRPSNGLRFGWGCATVSLSTKTIKGLNENDFIMASKLDRLLDRPDGFLDHKL
jgi:hypothetical protein